MEPVLLSSSSSLLDAVGLELSEEEAEDELERSEDFEGDPLDDLDWIRFFVLSRPFTAESILSSSELGTDDEDDIGQDDLEGEAS